MQNSKGHISAIFEKLVSFPFFLCRNHFGQWVFCGTSRFYLPLFRQWNMSPSWAWSKAQRTAANTKPRGFLISCGWKIYSCCNSNNTTEDNNFTKDNMCKFLYSTEELALLRVIAAILFSKDIRCTGQAQMSWISGDVPRRPVHLALLLVSERSSNIPPSLQSVVILLLPLSIVRKLHRVELIVAGTCSCRCSQSLVTTEPRRRWWLKLVASWWVLT